MAAKAQTPKLASRSPLFSGIKINYVLYTLLLCAVFCLGYLLARVQILEGGNSDIGSIDVGEFPPLGKSNAKVTIVEFSDLQCPFCRRFFIDTFPQLKKEYIDTGKVKIYYRSYPLSFHPMAVPSALAAECADDQGKFWEFHDKAYHEQEKQGQATITYTNDDLKKWAQAIGLNMNKFNKCFDSKQHQDLVDKDAAAGSAAGVSGTPTFYINGTQLVGAQPFSAFKALIDQELKK